MSDTGVGVVFCVRAERSAARCFGFWGIEVIFEVQLGRHKADNLILQSPLF